MSNFGIFPKIPLDTDGTMPVTLPQSETERFALQVGLLRNIWLELVKMNMLLKEAFDYDDDDIGER